MLAVRWFILFFILGGELHFSRAQTPSPIKEVRPDVFQMEDITFSKQNQTVTFPAKVNMRIGILEYLLVQESGKTHESLFSTKIDPVQLQVVMLLLGVKIPADNDKAPPDQLDATYLANAPKLKGEPIAVTVSWQKEGREVRVPLDDLILKKDAPVQGGTWIYNGSMVIEGKFLAQLEGSLIALVTDPAALMNNPRPGSNDDQIWSPRTGNIPPLETPVEITLKLLPKKSAP